MPATIYALSTPPGISAVAIIRISGPDSFRAVGKLCKQKTAFKLDKRKTHLRKIFSHGGKLLDEGFVVCFDKMVRWYRSSVPEDELSNKKCQKKGPN